MGYCAPAGKSWAGFAGAALKKSGMNVAAQ
jgi:hypothetical protein